LPRGVGPVGHPAGAARRLAVRPRPDQRDPLLQPGGTAGLQPRHAAADRSASPAPLSVRPCRLAEILPLLSQDDGLRADFIPGRGAGGGDELSDRVIAESREPIAAAAPGSWRREAAPGRRAVGDGHCWPSPAQELLLGAALIEGPRGRAAWAELRTT